MTYQLIAVEDTAPGPCVDVGVTWNGSDTITITQAVVATSLTLSGSLTGGAASDIDINSGKFTVAASTRDTYIDGALTVRGRSVFQDSCGFGANVHDEQSGSITIAVDTLYDSYSVGDVQLDATLPDGVADGQLKVIKLDTKGTANMVVFPTNFWDGSSITFDTNGQSVILVWDGSLWNLVYTNATVA